MVKNFSGPPGTLTHSFRNPIAIISYIMETTFILVALVETPIVHDHLLLFQN